jgi:Holliday junction resolvase-like predicted endonuclease
VPYVTPIPNRIAQLKLDWLRLNRGKSAEQLACRFLQQQGYTLVTQNYRNRRGEIDLIVENETML